MCPRHVWSWRGLWRGLACRVQCDKPGPGCREGAKELVLLPACKPRCSLLPWDPPFPLPTPHSHWPQTYLVLCRSLRWCQSHRQRQHSTSRAGWSARRHGAGGATGVVALSFMPGVPRVKLHCLSLVVALGDGGHAPMGRCRQAMGGLGQSW